MFLIGCYTALRFSDFTQIKDENIIDNGTKIRIKTQKTGEIVIIPLHFRVKEIIKKYNGHTPPTISNQKLNKYIKEVGELAKIDTPIVKEKKDGKLIFNHTYKKYELISSHTARRTAITNMVKAKIPTYKIMLISGHKTEQAFRKYIKLTKDENATDLASHDYFKPQQKTS